MGHEKPHHAAWSEFGPIRLRAFGNFSIRVNDQKLLGKIVGTDGHFTVDEINARLKTLAVTRFSDAIGEPHSRA